MKAFPFVVLAFAIIAPTIWAVSVLEFDVSFESVELRMSFMNESVTDFLCTYAMDGLVFGKGVFCGNSLNFSLI